MSEDKKYYEQMTENQPVSKKKSKGFRLIIKFILKVVMTLIVSFGIYCVLGSLEDFVAKIYNCQFYFTNNNMYEFIVLLGVLFPAKFLVDLLYCKLISSDGVKDVKFYFINRVPIIVVTILLLGVLAIENSYVTKDSIKYCSLLGMEYTTYEFDEVVAVGAEIRGDGEFYYVIDVEERELCVHDPCGLEGLDMFIDGLKKLEQFDKMLVDNGVIKFIDDSYVPDIVEDELEIVERIMYYFGEEELDLDESDGDVL